MSHLDELVDTMLWEGHQLYPYTPSATKSATPTPFGIAYPPAYAAASPYTHERVRLQCVATAGPSVSASVHFLQGGEAHRLDLSNPGEPIAFASGDIRAVATLTAEAIGTFERVTVLLENTTDVPDDLTRTEALEASLRSVHVVLRCAAGGRFMSPIDPPEEAATAVMTCHSVNIFPVLAAPADDAVLGAAIMLPDHPHIAAESEGSPPCDLPEIDEALLLQVLATSSVSSIVTG